MSLWAYLPALSNGFVYEDANWRGKLGLEAPGLYNFVGSDPFTFHLVSLLLHGLTALVLFDVGRRIASPLAGLLASAFFLLHPMNTEAVAYIANQPELLAGLCLALAGWLLVISPHEGWLGTLAACLVGLGAVWTKPSAVVVLGLLPVLAWVLGQRRRSASFLLIGSLWGVGLLLTRGVQIVNNPYTWGSEFGAWHYAGIQLVTAGLQVWHVLWPVGVTLEADTAVASLTALWAACAGLLCLALLPSRGVRLGLVWAALCLWPRFVLRTPEVLHEHHWYPVLLGWSLLIGIGLTRPTCA